MEPNRELIKGSTQTLILAVLRDAPMHGYAIAREVQRRSQSALRFGEGTLYPALQALERDGLVTPRWEAPVSGPARKVYHITQAGQNELQKRTRVWHSFATAVENVLGGQPDAEPT